jgi:PEP-CTERM motif
LISFESDVPVGPNNTFSHPGTPLITQVVSKGPLAPGSGTFTEKPVPTPVMPGMAPLEALYEYNAELNFGKEFKQEPNKVYWLKIVALVENQQTQWGWHDRDWSILDPFASTPPAVVPGETTSPAPIVDPVKGFTGFVHHFQDDAVQGPISVFPNPSNPIMPTIEQTGWTPQHYIFPWDGPDVIQQYSKDLAFELYTRVPEPTSIMMIGSGALALAAIRRRRAT